MAARTGYPVTESSVGCEVPPAEDEGPEDTAWVVFLVDDVISADVQWRRFLALSRSLEGVHFEAVGERGR